MRRADVHESTQLQTPGLMRLTLVASFWTWKCSGVLGDPERLNEIT